MDLTSWVLKIVGIISLTVITEIIIPHSKTQKIIKGVMAFITVLVIATPIVAIFNGDIETNFTNNDKEYSYNEELSSTIFDIRYKTALEELKTILLENDVVDATIELNAKNNETFLEIENIKINLDNAVILNKDKNTIDLEELIELIAKKFNVSNERVIFV